MTSSINHQRGRVFVRGLLMQTRHTVANGCGMGYSAAVAAATAEWGAAQADLIAKAAVSPISISDTGSDAARDFLALVRERSLFGRLVGLRRVPFNVRDLKFVTGAKGHWVAGAKPIPMSKSTLAGTTLKPLRVAGVVAVTKEVLNAQGEVAEQAFQADLEGAISGVLDKTFLDPTSAGVAGESPASVTNGATTLAATGTLSTDIAAVINAFNGDLSAAYWVTDPTTAAGIALATDAGGRYLFPEVGPRGGSILGIPLVTTRESPRSTTGQLTLIDPSSIDTNIENLSISVAKEATVQMSDTPTDTASATFVSLWQVDAVGFLAVCSANWQVQRPGAVVVLTGV